MRNRLVLPLLMALVAACRMPPSRTGEATVGAPAPDVLSPAIVAAPQATEPDLADVPHPAPHSEVAVDEKAPSAHAASPAAEAQRAVHLAHEAYVAALNSNDLTRVLGMLTDDVELLSGSAAPMVGKDAVRPWLAGYLAIYTTHWTKTVQEFDVSGDSAFARYSWRSVDAPLAGGALVQGTGLGLVQFRRCDDGVWRVARDAWDVDRAPRK